jgi:hypothetical protein
MTNGGVDMTPEQFVWFLLGYTERTGCSVPNEEDWIYILNTLAEVTDVSKL